MTNNCQRHDVTNIAVTLNAPRPEANWVTNRNNRPRISTKIQGNILNLFLKGEKFSPSPRSSLASQSTVQPCMWYIHRFSLSSSLSSLSSSLTQSLYIYYCTSHVLNRTYLWTSWDILLRQGAKNRVLIVVGGRKGSSSLASTELFDYPGWWLQASKFFSTSHRLTAGASWRLAGSLPSPRYQLDQVGTNILNWSLLP